MSYIIGLDIGATKIAAGLVWQNQLPKITKIPTQSHLGKKIILENILKATNIFFHQKVKAIGIGIAGQIDYKKGILLSSPNMAANFKNVNLKKILEKKFKRPVFVENDANCFTLAESVLGAGRYYKNVVGITLGTGIGGGIVINKQIYHGRNGLAGELGHMTIVEDGLTCSCGKNGHLEVYASARAMTYFYKKFTGKDLDTFQIEKLANRGEKNALRVFKIMSDMLGIGLANIINIINPDIIVIGGGLVRVKKIWQDALMKAKNEVVYPTLKNTPIVGSKLADNAPILGAALNAQNNLK